MFASIPKQRVAIELKQTEDPPKQFKREYIWEFFRKFMFVLVCFGLIRNISVYFGCFDIGSKHRNKPKFFLFGFYEANMKQILFRFAWFEPKFIFVSFKDTLVGINHARTGHGCLAWQLYLLLRYISEGYWHNKF